MASPVGRWRARGSLAARMMALVITGGLVVTLLVSAMQLYSQHRREMDTLKRQFVQIEEAFLPSVVAAVWTSDQRMQATIIEGIRHLPQVEYVAITANDTPPLTSGARGAQRWLSREYPLRHSFLGKDTELGQLQVVVGLDGIYRSLFARAELVLAGEAVKIFSLAALLLWFFYTLVGRHLRIMADYTQTMDLAHLDTPLRLPRAPSPQPDELEALVAAINRMRENLAADLSHRQVLERELLDNEARYRMFVEGTNDLITMVDGEGRFRYVNHVAERIFGLEPEACRGRLAFDFIHPDDRERTAAAFTRWLHTRQGHFGIENRQVNQSTGEVFTMHWSCSIHGGDNGAALIVNGIARDISELKRNEDEMLRLRNLESLALLAGGLAHDFNNLLMVILGNIDLAMASLSPADPSHALLRDAVAASDRARQLTGQLLTFSKGGAPMKERCHLPELIEECAALVLSGSKVRFLSRYAADLWPVELDKNQMRQVFHNLFLNAKEAMHDGGAISVTAENERLSVGGHANLAEGDYLRITINDQGCGMDAQTLAKIFVPYFTTKHMGARKGTGLGLSICHSVVSKHGGAISAVSELGRGTTFEVYLPAAAVARSAAVPSAVSGTERGRILVMDDDESVITILRGMLERLGYQTVAAREGGEAVALFGAAISAGQPFAAVILDLTIRGGMGGEQAMAELAAIDPQVKAVVASGYADSPIVTDYQRYGFRAALVKPFRQEALATVLRALFASGETTGADQA